MSGLREKLTLKNACLGTLLFLCVFIPFRSPLALITSDWIKAIPDILILLLLVWYFISVRGRVKLSLPDFLFLDFLLLGFLTSVLINHVGLFVYAAQVRSIALYYVFYFIARNVRLGHKDIILTVWVLQGVSVLLLVLGIVEKLFNKEFLFPQSVAAGIIAPSNFTRVYSMFFNPNTYAAFLIIVFFLTLYKSLVLKSKNHILIYYVLSLSIMLTMSRSAFIIGVAGFAAALLFLWLRRCPVQWLRSGVLLLITAAFCFGSWTLISQTNRFYSRNIEVVDWDSQKKLDAAQFNITDRLGELTNESIVQKSNNNGRIYIAKKGLEVFRDYPVFGTGFGTFGSSASLSYIPAIYEKYDLYERFYTDNEYIKVLVETGVAGTLLFAAFMVSVLLKHRKNAFKVLVCVIIAWLGLFYNVFEVQIAALLLWAVLSFEDVPIEFPDKPDTQGALKKQH